MGILNLDTFINHVFSKEKIKLSDSDRLELEKSFSFLESFAADKIIYGINTGFGPMAQFKVSKEKLNKLQYNLIRSHANGLGSALDATYSRAVLVARLNNFMQFKSGVSPNVVETIIAFLNNNISPEIFEHGGVGASGDLVQLSHVAQNLIGEGYVYYMGKRVKTVDLMSKLNIKPLKLKLRDGLGLINGTSCMTGISAINVFYSLRLINWGLACSSILNEIVESFDDSFSKELNSAKLHEGQNEAASFMRSFLKDSKLIRNRNDFYNNSSELKKLKLKQKLQEYYSIRCIPQIIGPIVDTLNFSKNIIENELNSTNDNPIISIENNNVYHGGNFHGDYVSLEMDKVKIAMCKLSMLVERQLNFLLNPNLNNKFPLFLNLKRLGYNFGVQGLQFVATSTTAENQTLSNPMYVHSIPSNNDNQDIVSMGANSALITKKVIDNCFQVMAIHVFAICQAIDFLPKEDFNKLSSNTVKVYTSIRKVAPVIDEDKSQSETLNSLIQHIKTHTINL